MRINDRVPSVNGVGAGQIATCNIPIGRRIHALQINTINPGTGSASLTLAQLPDIKLKVNNEVVREYSAADLDVINQYNKRPSYATTGGILTMFMDRGPFKERFFEETTALNTGDRDPKSGRIIEAVSLEITQSAGTTPYLAVNAIYSERLVGAGPGDVLRSLPRTYALTAVGDYTITDLDAGDVLHPLLGAIYFKTAQTTNLLMKRGTETVFDRKNAENTAHQLVSGYRTPQSGWYMYDPCEEGYGGNLLQLTNFVRGSFTQKLTMAAAETITVYPEYVGVIAR